MARYRVLTVSRPGYLRTPLSVGRTPAEQARACSELLDSLGINSVVLIGASAGGPSAISFASLYPNKTLGLLGIFPISQPMLFEEEKPFFYGSDFSFWMVANASDHSFGRKLVSFFVSDQGILERVNSGRESLLKAWPPSRRLSGDENDEAQFAHLDLFNGPEITVPTLIIHGTDDSNVPFSQSKELTDRISGSVLHPIVGGTHFMFDTHSEEIIPVIAEFLVMVTSEK